jgi:hypothetical protein
MKCQLPWLPSATDTQDYKNITVSLYAAYIYNIYGYIETIQQW